MDKRISRRRLLKIIAVAGGATAASTMLPNKWAKPVVEVGVLPAHAQVSPTVEVTATATLEPVIIVTCHLANADQQQTLIRPTDTVETYAIIRTTRPNIESIELQMALSVDGLVLETDRGVAVIGPDNDPNEATYRPSDIDLTPFNLNPGDRLTATFSFVDPGDGADVCSRASTIASP